MTETTTDDARFAPVHDLSTRYPSTEPAYSAQLAVVDSGRSRPVIALRTEYS